MSSPQTDVRPIPRGSAFHYVQDWTETAFRSILSLPSVTWVGQDKQCIVSWNAYLTWLALRVDIGPKQTKNGRLGLPRMIVTHRCLTGSRVCQSAQCATMRPSCRASPMRWRRSKITQRLIRFLGSRHAWGSVKRSTLPHRKIRKVCQSTCWGFVNSTPGTAVHRSSRAVDIRN